MSPVRVLLWFSTMSAVAADFVTGQLGDAHEILDNPMGAAYFAALPPSAPIEGSILAATDEGQGVNFAVNFANLPSTGGPFCILHRIFRRRSVILTTSKCTTFTHLPFPQMGIVPAPSLISILLYVAKYHPVTARSHRPVKSETSRASTAPSTVHQPT